MPREIFLIFKKIAVRPDLPNSGVGNQLHRLAETISRDEGYTGMILETIKEADWLYNWYIHLGYTQIGSYRYESGQVDTVLMIKIFQERKQ